MKSNLRVIRFEVAGSVGEQRAENKTYIYFMLPSVNPSQTPNPILHAPFEGLHIHRPSRCLLARPSTFYLGPLTYPSFGVYPLPPPSASLQRVLGHVSFLKYLQTLEPHSVQDRASLLCYLSTLPSDPASIGNVLISKFLLIILFLIFLF